MYLPPSWSHTVALSCLRNLWTLLCRPCIICQCQCNGSGRNENALSIVVLLTKYLWFPLCNRYKTIRWGIYFNFFWRMWSVDNFKLSYNYCKLQGWAVRWRWRCTGGGGTSSWSSPCTPCSAPSGTPGAPSRRSPWQSSRRGPPLTSPTSPTGVICYFLFSIILFNMVTLTLHYN